jgi:hypothetical protein
LGQRRERQDGRHRLVFLSAACVVFGVFYSVNGGLAYFFNFLVSPEIRATARVMPFLSFFALVIVLLQIETLWRRAGYRRVVGFVACVVLAAATLPAIGQLGAKSRTMMNDPRMMAELRSVENVIQVKNARSLQAILQLPHTYWPEAPAIRQFASSSLLKYFVLDQKRSATRWSHGASVGQASFVIVKKLVEDHGGSGLAEAARGVGFDAILIEKLAYDEAELGVLTRDLDADPLICKILDDQALLFYSIMPGRC